VGLPLAVLVLLCRRLAWSVMAAGALSLVVAAALAAPWYLVVERAEPGYLRYFFLERHVMGFTTTTQLHGHREWWYYLPILLAGSLPWAPTLPGAWRPDRGGRLEALRRVAVVWLLVDVIFLSAAGSKLATYVLPIFPAVAVLVAVAWHVAPRRDGGRPPATFGPLVAGQQAAGALLLPGIIAWGVWLAGLPSLLTTWLAGLAVAAAWLAAARSAGRWPLARSFAATLTLMVVTLSVAYCTVFPVAAEQATARDLAAHFNAQGRLPPRLWIVDERVGSFLFYLDPALRARLEPQTVEGVPLGRALVQAGGIPGTIVALPSASMTRLAARARLEHINSEAAGRYRLYDGTALRSAPPRR
jgi:4-amino-4-deoxy-L-arabinose transferase-like glycosyltransferase